MTADYSGPINVAGPDVLSLGEIVRMIGTQLGQMAVTKAVPDAPGNVIADLELMALVLGPPRVRFIDGVAEVCREAAAQLTIEGR